MDSAGALKELKDYQSTRKGAGDYYSQYQNELGVGDARARSDDLKGLIRNTETQLKGVGESVAGRTRGNLVTEAQRARLQNLESAPISEQLGTLQGSYSDEQQNYRDLLGQASTQAGLAYQTDADRAAALQNTYNNVFQQEQAAAQRRQQEEETRRWWEQYNESKRQFEANLAESAKTRQASLARIASLSASPSVSQSAQLGASTPIYDKSSGQILGYDTPTKSFQTEAGWAKQDQEDRDRNTNENWNKIGRAIATQGPLALIGKGWAW